MLDIQDYTYALAFFTFPIHLALVLRSIWQSNLARLNLPHPEAVFEIGFFRRNPVPCTFHLFTDTTLAQSIYIYLYIQSLYFGS